MPTIQEEIDNNKDPIDTPLEAEINSKNGGPIDTIAEYKRFREEQIKQGIFSEKLPNTPNKKEELEEKNAPSP